jgi:tetratricopeptide (TPR) repeat protein
MAGKYLIEAGKENQGIKVLKTYIRYHPENSAPYQNIAKFYMNNSKYPEAIEWHNKAVKQDSQTYSSYYALGICYECMEDYKMAIESMEKFLELCPDDPEALSAIGRFKIELSAIDKSKFKDNTDSEIVDNGIWELEASMAEDPDSWVVPSELIKAYYQNGMMENIENLQKKYTNLINNHFFQNDLAGIYHEAGQTSRAIECKLIFVKKYQKLIKNSLMEDFEDSESIDCFLSAVKELQKMDTENRECHNFIHFIEKYPELNKKFKELS